MLNFEKLISGPQGGKDQVEAYLLDFFSKKNRKDYQIDPDTDEDQRKAIRIMFESKKDLPERAELALSHDPLCLEAFFVYYLLSEDVFVNYRFRSYYDQISHFGDLSDYQKKCYLKILDFYVEFLLDIGNYTTAIKVQKQILKLGGKSERDIDRLCFMYCMIEKADDLYRLYLDQAFNAYDYLLLIVTLLKHEDTLKAAEVVEDMLKNVKYAEYLDHLWDLDEKDSEQEAFYQTVEDCYEYISAIPDFFTFISQVHHPVAEE